MFMTSMLTLHGIDRILLAIIFFNSNFSFCNNDMTLPNRVIFKNLGHIWPDGQVYSMYDVNII